MKAEDNLEGVLVARKRDPCNPVGVIIGYAGKRAIIGNYPSGTLYLGWNGLCRYKPLHSKTGYSYIVFKLLLPKK